MIREWMYENKVYTYYLKQLYFYIGEKEGFLSYNKDNILYLQYKGYLVAQLVAENRRIFLIPFNIEKTDLVTNKLRHEYDKYFFDKQKSDKMFPLKEVNILHFVDYLDCVKSKIDDGFENYLKLFTGGKTENIGYLNINIDNAFSLQSLNELINMYNELYKVIFEILHQAHSETVVDEYFIPVVESIHMASKGNLIVAGIEVVLKIVDELISGILDLSLSFEEYKIKRQRLENERKVAEASPEVMKAISDMILELDRISVAYRNTTDEYVKNFSRQHIYNLREKIYVLQGGEHVNYLV